MAASVQPECSAHRTEGSLARPLLDLCFTWNFTVVTLRGWHCPRIVADKVTVHIQKEPEACPPAVPYCTVQAGCCIPANYHTCARQRCHRDTNIAKAEVVSVLSIAWTEKAQTGKCCLNTGVAHVRPAAPSW